MIVNTFNSDKKIFNKKEYDKNIRIFLVFGIFGFFLLLRFFYTINIITGESMQPTLKNGGWFISFNNFTEKDITYNSIITFSNDKTENKLYIKRVVALPYDTIQIIDGSLYVNDVLIVDNFSPIKDSGIAKNKQVLNDNEYFVLGDNRNNSKDSRMIGPITFKEIKSVLINR